MRSGRQKLPKTRLYCLFFRVWDLDLDLERRKKDDNTGNAALIFEKCIIKDIFILICILICNCLKKGQSIKLINTLAKLPNMVGKHTCHSYSATICFKICHLFKNMPFKTMKHCFIHSSCVTACLRILRIEKLPIRKKGTSNIGLCKEYTQVFHVIYGFCHLLAHDLPPLRC